MQSVLYTADSKMENTAARKRGGYSKSLGTVAFASECHDIHPAARSLQFMAAAAVNVHSSANASDQACGKSCTDFLSFFSRTGYKNLNILSTPTWTNFFSR